MALQVQYPVLDLLRAALIPELRADVATGAPGDVHFILIPVTATGADPHELSVVLLDLNLSVPAAYLTVIALGIQLRIASLLVY